MPLTMATMGEVNKIVKVGGNEETRRFLENLGFIAGTEISCIFDRRKPDCKCQGFQNCSQ